MMTSSTGFAMFPLTKPKQHPVSHTCRVVTLRIRPSLLDFGERVAELLDVDDDELVGVLDAVVEVAERVERRAFEVVLVHLLGEPSSVSDRCRSSACQQRL